MRTRRRQWITTLGGAATMIIVALAVGYFVVLPRMVRQQVETLLRNAGIEHATFEVERATLWRTRLGDMVLGADGQVKAQRVSVTYAPADVGHGEVKQITITNLRLVIESTGGRIDLGPLSNVDFAGQNGGVGGGGGDSTRDPLPVRGVHLEDSRLVIQTPEKSIEIPIEGDLVAAEGGTNDLRLQVGLGAPCLIRGRLDPASGDATARLECDLADADRVLAIIHALFPAAEVEFAGALSATASLQWQQGRGVLEARLAANGAEAAEAATAGATTAKMDDLGGTNLTVRQGVLKIDAIFGPAAEESLRLAIEDATVAGSNFQVEGVEGALHLSGFAPPASPPGQVLRARRLEIGGAEMTNGTVQFHVQSPTALEIERTSWNWLGGEVSTGNVEVAAGEPIELVLNADNVELRQVLDLLAEEHAEGSGRLSGELPVRIEGSDVKFGEGRFSAVSDGQIEIRNVDALDAAAVNAPAVQPSQQEQVRRNIVEALKDFEYDVLKAELINEPDGSLSAKVRIAGRGRTGARQAIDYELRVRGLDVLLKTLLEERRAIAEPATGASAGKAGS